MSFRPKIAVIHPFLRPVGGSEARAMHIADTLADDYDVTLVTMGAPDLEQLNEYYGTHIDKDKIRVVSFRVPFLTKKHLHALRPYRLARYCVKNASKYDVMISTYNLMDFGGRGIQFIADFSFNDELREAAQTRSHDFFGILRRKHFIRWAYLEAVRRLSGTSRTGWRKNLTVANSDWTSRIMRETYGLETARIYPPVLDAFPEVPWEERENGFICLGRISPEKNIEMVIDVLHIVRKKGWDVHLHIVGDSDDSGYLEKIKKLCERSGSWISLEGKMSGPAKARFVSRHRYGVSACRNEAFGISVAEMAKAGCIAWVYDGGGQREIVEHPDLIFSGVEDAAEKICRILDDEKRQCYLLEILKKRAGDFSTERFRKDVRSLIKNYLENEVS